MFVLKKDIIFTQSVEFEIVGQNPLPVLGDDTHLCFEIGHLSNFGALGEKGWPKVRGFLSKFFKKNIDLLPDSHSLPFPLKGDIKDGENNKYSLPYEWYPTWHPPTDQVKSNVVQLNMCTQIEIPANTIVSFKVTPLADFKVKRITWTTSDFMERLEKIK